MKRKMTWFGLILLGAIGGFALAVMIYSSIMINLSRIQYQENVSSERIKAAFHTQKESSNVEGVDLTTSRIETEECKDMYGKDSIIHWRNSTKEYCSNPSERSITCFEATHFEPFSESPFPVTTCRFQNLMKQRNFWTPACEYDQSNNFSLSKLWYDSGAGYILDKIKLQSPPDMNTACRHVEMRPTFMFMREAGIAANVFHEMAQIFALYVTKHVHGIGDSYNSSQVLLVAFDKEQRASKSGFVGRCDELLGAFSSHPVLYHEDIPDDTCFTNAMTVVGGGENMGLWYKWGKLISCQRSPVVMSFAHFLLQGIGIQPVSPSSLSGTPRVCWISRGSNYTRNLRYEDLFIAELQRENPELDLHVGVYGSDDLKSLRSQILWTQKCSVMIGAHGAGLTHCMWMPEESVLVEILPPRKGSYRTLARLLGHQYLHVPGIYDIGVDFDKAKVV